MEADNIIYPVNTQYLNDEDSLAEGAKEQEQVLTSAPQLKQAIERISKCIAFLKSPVGYEAEDLKVIENYMHVTAGRQLAIGILEPELKYLEELLTAYTE